jgi:hypothetical protein
VEEEPLIMSMPAISDVVTTKPTHSKDYVGLVVARFVRLPRHEKITKQDLAKVVDDDPRRVVNAQVAVVGIFQSLLELCHGVTCGMIHRDANRVHSAAISNDCFTIGGLHAQQHVAHYECTTS